MKTKMKILATVKIWIVIYPSITLFLFFFGHAIAGFPLYARTLILTVALVPWIVFVGVPVVDNLLVRFSRLKNKQ